MNRAEVLERVEPISENTQVRNIDHTTRTKVVMTPDMVVLRPGSGARMLQIQPEGVQKLATFAKFPADLAKELSPDTFGRVATELLDRKRRYAVVLQEGAIVDFLNPRRNPAVSPERLLRTIESRIGHTEYNRVLISDHTATIEVVGDRQQAVVPGDLVRGGALVSFSPIGSTVPFVQSFAVRLECTNGATTEDVLRKFQYGGGEGDDVWQFFRESLKEAYRSLSRITNQWRKLNGQRVPAADRPLILQALLNQAGITGRNAEAIRAEALRNPPETHYDMMNLITWGSSHLLEQPRQIQRAQAAAAKFSVEVVHQRTCPVCRSTR